MKKTALGWLAAVAAAGVSCLSTAVRAEVFEWADGAVVDVGCQGLGDNNYNSNADTMHFLGSGTIHGSTAGRNHVALTWVRRRMPATGSRIRRSST